MSLRRKAARADPPEALHARIEEFVRACRSPAIFEPGEKTIPLEPGRFDLQIRGSAVLLHVWSAETSLVRRILRVGREENGRIQLVTRRLAQGEGEMLVLDLARVGAEIERRAGRLEFRERFRRMLARQFGGWTIAQISAAPDLEHSLSPAYVRAFLTKGTSALAAIAADPEAGAGSTRAAVCDQILSFGLIWLHYLRHRERRRTVEGLKIFLPQGRTAATSSRLAFLDRERASCELFAFDSQGFTSPLDEKNYGNLATSLDPASPVPQPAGPVAQWIRRLIDEFGAEAVARPDGVLSIRLRGLEFARAMERQMTYGVGDERPVTGGNFYEVEALARRIAEERRADAAPRESAFYHMAPEKWLESMVRADPAAIDGSLLPEPLYTQVPAVAGSERGVIDLLGSERSGRLVVVEIKASEDVHLPLQGLDYWMRVKWHLDRGEFQKRGYFPGLAIQPTPPRLMLVSPVFHFHPTTETILQYFSQQVEVERIGLSADWRRSLRVVFRAKGAEKPA
ncbi:MAG TPA: hypothetical protein VFA54_16905 [Bryobacterales bacterium]|jgi:hypothetical protein|nr:hypothetical protein [Bryobacterales bacterium]